MFLRIGVIVLLLSVTLAAGAAATVVGLRNEPPETTVSSVKSQAPETTAEDKRKPDLGEKLEIDKEESEPKAREPRPKKPAPRKEPPARKEPPPPEEPAPAPLPVPDLPRPTVEEQTSAEKPRRYEPKPSADMTLTVEALGIYDAPVVSSDSLQALDTGLMHVPETSFPWDESAQRNVYIAGHYLGYPDTASRLVFYNLDKLGEGDKVVLEDRGGRAYKYRVSESFAASPEESWVMGQEVGRDMITLQTCIPPNFGERLIVRADRV